MRWRSIFEGRKANEKKMQGEAIEEKWRSARGSGEAPIDLMAKTKNLAVLVSTIAVSPPRRRPEETSLEK